MKRLPLAIWAMVVGAFAMGADEFIVAGVVREIATAFDVSYGAVGHLESVYALGVAVGAPVFTVLGVRFGRRSMLFSTAVVFLLGNVLSALAPTYEWVMAGRVVSATAHGAFLGIAAVFAAELVEPARKGRAVALVFSGLTAATVLGAPIGAAVGQALGWRFTFWTLVVLGGLAILGLLATLPANANTTRTASTADAAQHHSGHATLSDADLDGLDAHALAHLGGGGHGPTMAEQARALTRPGVWGALLVTLLGYGGVFTSYVYVAPQITDVTGMEPGWITPMLLLFGAGLFVGNHLGGKFADRNLPVAVMVTLSSLAVSLFAMTAAIRTPVTAVVMMFVFGMAAFSVVAPLQLRVMTAAGHAPDVASAANISAFTLGSAIGIYLGGAAIDGGLGLASVNWVGGLMTLAGLAVAALTLRTQNADAHTHTQAGAPVHEHGQAGAPVHEHGQQAGAPVHEHAQAGASVHEPEHTRHHTH